jgi:hypothetical protein
MVPVVQLDHTNIEDMIALSLYSLDRKCGAVTLCPSKHIGPHVARWALVHLSRRGFGDIRLRTDPDVSMKSLASKIKEGMKGSRVMLEETAVQSHASLGGVERYRREVQEEMRALKGYLERQFNQKLPLQKSFVAWLLRHVSWTLYRYHVPRSLGMTAYRQQHADDYRGFVLCFGETAMARRPEDTAQLRRSSKWEG